MLKFCKTPASPCPHPACLPTYTYLPTYGKLLKEITPAMKVGYRNQ